MAKKSNENKWLQIGNFLLGVDKNAHGSYVVLKTVSGQWTVRWKDDCLMFAMMLNLMANAADDNNVKEYLHSLITVMFITTSYTHDLIALAAKNEMPFCEGVAKLLKEQTDYENSLDEKPTKEEEKQALKEVGEMTEIQEELEKLDEADGN
jgi:hypothetical protein